MQRSYHSNGAAPWGCAVVPHTSKGKDHMNNHYSNRFKLGGTQSNRLISYKKNQFHSHLDTIECVWRGQLLNTQIRSIIGRGWGWGWGGSALSWRLMHFHGAKSHSKRLAQARLHGRGQWSWQGIGWEPASSLGRRGEEWRLAGHLGILPTGDRFPAASPLAPPAPVFFIP